MKPGSGLKYGIGALIVDGLLILETANDVRTGKLTWTQFAIILMVCMIITCLLAALFRRRRRKHQNPSQSKTDETDGTDR